MNPQDNERLTKVGPGTLMGNLLRHYWMPAFLEEESRRAGRSTGAAASAR